MNTIHVQVRSGDTWSNVSTVQYDPSRETTRRIGDTTYFSRSGAIRQVISHMQAWRDSDQFTGRQMRVAEIVQSGRATETKLITGVGAS